MQWRLKRVNNNNNNNYNYNNNNNNNSNNNNAMELGCHSKKSGNLQTGDRDNANSVQEFGDCVGDKHSFR